MSSAQDPGLVLEKENDPPALPKTRKKKKGKNSPASKSGLRDDGDNVAEEQLGAMGQIATATQTNPAPPPTRASVARIDKAAATIMQRAMEGADVMLYGHDMPVDHALKSNTALGAEPAVGGNPPGDGQSEPVADGKQQSPGTEIKTKSPVHPDVLNIRLRRKLFVRFGKYVTPEDKLTQFVNDVTAKPTQWSSNADAVQQLMLIAQRAGLPSKFVMGLGDCDTYDQALVFFVESESLPEVEGDDSAAECVEGDEHMADATGAGKSTPEITPEDMSVSEEEPPHHSTKAKGKKAAKKPLVPLALTEEEAEHFDLPLNSKRPKIVARIREYWNEHLECHPERKKLYEDSKGPKLDDLLKGNRLELTEGLLELRATCKKLRAKERAKSRKDAAEAEQSAKPGKALKRADKASPTPVAAAKPSYEELANRLEQVERLLLAQHQAPSAPQVGDDEGRVLFTNPWDTLEHVIPNMAAKVQLPSPKEFNGIVSILVPAHYSDLDAYAEALVKHAIRAKVPMAEMVLAYFKQHARIWAEHFFRTGILQLGIAASVVADAQQNKEVYPLFLQAFREQFGPQIICKQEEALEKLHSGRCSMAKDDYVALYYAKFMTVVSDAKLTPDTAGFLFRKGLPLNIREKCVTDASGKVLRTLNEVYRAALTRESTLRALAHDKPAPLNSASANFAQGKGGGRGRGSRHGGRPNEPWQDKRDQNGNSGGGYRSNQSGQRNGGSGGGGNGQRNNAGRFKGGVRKGTQRVGRKSRNENTGKKWHEHKHSAHVVQHNSQPPSPPPLSLQYTGDATGDDDRRVIIANASDIKDLEARLGMSLAAAFNKSGGRHRG